MPTNTQNDTPAGQSAVLALAHGSAPSTFEHLREIISNMLNVPEGQILLDSSFVDDLGADSLDAVELMLAVEEIFNFSEEIQEEDAIACKTVADAVALIDRLLPNDKFSEPRL